MTHHLQTRTGARAALALSVLATTMVLGSGTATAATCTPTSDRPTLQVEAVDTGPGDTVRVTGAGWCNEKSGGSTVAFKLDEGAYSRLDDQLHANRTIWAISEADPSDGTLDFLLSLPDGTDATSKPAFVEGTHSVRALSGSLKDGDPVRSVKSDDFVVGTYRPSGLPDPVDPAELVPALADRLVTRLDGARLTVDVDGGQPGQWVFVSLLTADGSARHPWGATWWQLDAAGRVTLGAGEAPVEGPHRIVVQSGQEGEVGQLLGWSTATWPVSTPSTPPTSSTTPKSKKPPKKAPTSPAPTPSGTPSASPLPLPAPVAQVPAPTLPGAVPADGTAAPVGELDRPVRSASDLPAELELTTTYDDPQLRVETGRPALDLFVHVYSGATVVPAGWVRTDDQGVALLDLRDVGDGDLRMTFATPEELVGWVPMSLGGADATSGAGGPEVVKMASAQDDDALLTAQDGWLAGIAGALLLGLGLGSVARGPVRPRRNA